MLGFDVSGGFRTAPKNARPATSRICGLILSVTDDDEKTSPVWRWPIEWAGSKRFWENVASNVVAGLIVGAAGLIVVLSGGFLSAEIAYVQVPA